MDWEEVAMVAEVTVPEGKVVVDEVAGAEETAVGTEGGAGERESAAGESALDTRTRWCHLRRIRCYCYRPCRRSIFRFGRYGLCRCPIA